MKMVAADHIANGPCAASPAGQFYTNPSRYNYVLAHTFGLSVAAGAITALGILFATLYREGILVAGWSVVLWIAVGAAFAAAIGAIAGVFFIWPFLGRLASCLQGAPFREDDHVWILSGEHKDTLAFVYDVWEERGQLRVDLGSEAKEGCADVFCMVSVCRARSEVRHTQMVNGHS